MLSGSERTTEEDLPRGDLLCLNPKPSKAQRCALLSICVYRVYGKTVFFFLKAVMNNTNSGDRRPLGVREAGAGRADWQMQ